ncbi:MAG: hypothetical protein R2697_22210 [Ilumatobacteraceae bacterium]
MLFDSWYQGQPLVISLLPELMGGAEPATLPGVFEGLQGARVGGTWSSRCRPKTPSAPMVALCSAFLRTPT